MDFFVHMSNKICDYLSLTDHIKAVEILADAGADLNIKDDDNLTPFCKARKLGNIKKYSLERLKWFNEMILIFLGFTNIEKLLAEKGASQTCTEDDL